jgi:FixJ family two-component response regulator
MDFIEKPFNDAEMRRLVEQCLEQERSSRTRRRTEADIARRLEHLTQREREVLNLIVAGKLNKQIADVLGISIKTVEAHRANIMEKLNANTVADLLKIALGAPQKA